MDIQKIVSEAIEIFSPNSKAPIVTFYSGVEGIKNIYLDTIKTLSVSPDKTLYAFLNPEVVHEDIYKWLTTFYVDERVKNGIYAHVFISNKDKSQRSLKYKELDDKEKRTTYFVEDYDKPFESEVNIYDDKVAFINFNPKGEIAGVIIHHSLIASTLKAFYLHYMWKI